MNWKLIFQLSLFGLAMAIATVFWISSNIEPVFWLAIFVLSAYFIAKNCSGKYFLHGFFVSLANCIWVTAAHVILFDNYIANHPNEGKMMADMHMNASPKLMMLMMGPAIGIISGLVLGSFAFIASKLRKKSS